MVDKKICAGFVSSDRSSFNSITFDYPSISILTQTKATVSQLL